MKMIRMINTIVIRNKKIIMIQSLEALRRIEEREIKDQTSIQDKTVMTKTNKTKIHLGIPHKRNNRNNRKRKEIKMIKLLVNLKKMQTIVSQLN